MVSDCGSDHRFTFASVKVSLIALFSALDVDMLISFVPTRAGQISQKE